MNIRNMKVNEVLKQISEKTRRKNAIIKMDMDKSKKFVVC
jgi:hypothetical protein